MAFVFAHVMLELHVAVKFAEVVTDSVALVAYCTPLFVNLKPDGRNISRLLCECC